MSPLYRGGRRQGATRSSREYGGATVYYCTGGAGKAVAEAADLMSLPGSGHVPVTNLERPGPAILRCPLCGLTRPVGYKRRRAIREAGLTEVDISALPF